jgi:hypothetical protein
VLDGGFPNRDGDIERENARFCGSRDCVAQRRETRLPAAFRQRHRKARVYEIEDRLD